MTDWRTRLTAELALARADGLKLGELAAQIGKSRDWPTRILKRGSNPGIDDVQKLCGAAKVDFTYIMTGQRGGPVHQELLNAMSNLTLNQLSALQDKLEIAPVMTDKVDEDPE